MSEKYQQLITALADVLEEFDGFMDWIDAGKSAPDQGQLDRLNSAREKGQSLLDELGVYSHVN